MRVFFLSSMPRKPAGGVRVIYRHVNILNELGFDSYVYHPLDSYHYKWADGVTPIYTGSTISFNDHIVIPDVYLGYMSSVVRAHLPTYSIYIQNPYILRSVFRFSNFERIAEAVKGAFRILCISDDTVKILAKMFPGCESKLIRVSWSHDADSFQQAKNKEPLITFMPRKNRDHVQLVIDCIKSHLPLHWKIIPIQGVTNNELRDLLSRSSIFLSFGSFEGLPAPPVEAAMSGNYVIGYHGNGGQEYWCAPNFTTINVCDIDAFSEAIISRVKSIENNKQCFVELESVVRDLKSKFSTKNEVKQLGEFAKALKTELDFDHLKKNTNYVLPFKTNYFKFHFDRVLTKVDQWLSIY